VRAADYPAQMQRNDFSLERLRHLREHDEQVAKEAFAASLGQRLRGQALLRHAQLAVRASEDATRGAANGPRSGHDLLAAQAWMERVRATSEEAALSLDRFEAEVEVRRAQLGRAAQQRAVLDRLKDRHRAETKLAAARLENAQLDEVAMSQHRRQVTS
jgi:flagellar export protein FliJ